MPQTATRTEWRNLKELAIRLCGSLEKFRLEDKLLVGLVSRFGPSQTEAMLQGALLLGWHTMKSLGSVEGTARAWAQERYWHEANQRPVKLPAPMRSALLKYLEAR